MTTQNISDRELLDAMGYEATDAEAAAMRSILNERRIESLDELSDAEFLALIPEAIKRATE